MKNKLKWLHSHKTFKFDTDDGDLDKHQYAEHPDNPGVYLVRNTPKNNGDFERAESLSEHHTEKVSVVENELAVYDVFELPGGRVFRRPSTNEDYDGFAHVKNGKKPEKEVDGAEVAEIIKDDGLWQ